MSGLSGLSGTSGLSGVSGLSGFSGISGPSGLTGMSGPSGLSGLSGQSGPSGQSGVVGGTQMVSNALIVPAPTGPSGWPAGSIFTTNVGCPQFSKVLGGGGAINSALNGGKVFLTLSSPNPPPAAPGVAQPIPLGPGGGWLAQGENDVALAPGESVTITAYVVCSLP
jgi:hypothetical protein